MFALRLLHVWAAGKINLLAATGNDSDSVTFSEWLDVMNHTAAILMLFLLPVSVATLYAVARHPALPLRSRRTINVHTLPRLMMRFCPTIIPVVAGKGPDGLMNDTTAENAWALKPEEFAEWFNLIERKNLNRDVTREVFEAQLGERHRGLGGFQAHERALFAVFGLQVFLNDRDSATALLDNLNRSCLVRGLLWFRKESVRDPLFGLADRAFQRVSQAPGVDEWLEMHGYVRSALVGLYGRDLRLSPNRFRWLKGLDRTLWYSLQTANTAKVFVEGAGVVAQARAECAAHRLGLPRPGLLVTEAVDGLLDDLEGIGLVFPPPPATPPPRKKRDIPLMAALYSADGVPADDE